jgi:hypothetical protein
MPDRTLSAQTIRNIITLHALSHLSYRELSRLLHIAPSTVGKYLSAFERSSLSHAKTRGLSDEGLVDLLSPAPVRSTAGTGHSSAYFQPFTKTSVTPQPRSWINGNSTTGNARAAIVIPASLNYMPSGFRPTAYQSGPEIGGRCPLRMTTTKR